jgi:flagellar FliL protein
MARKEKEQAKDQEQAQDGGQKKKGGILKWIILLVFLLLLGGGGFFAYTFFLAPSGQNATNTVESGTDKADEALQNTSMVSLPPFVVNLADPLGRRYLKISLDMELSGEQAAGRVEAQMPKIKDKLLLLLSSKTYSDLSTMSAKMELKGEIVNRVNQVLGENVVKGVYFTEFIIQ